MLLGLAVTALVLLVLLWQLTLPALRRAWGSRPWGSRRGAARLMTPEGTRSNAQHEGYDPGRELRAEQRARRLLRSCVNQDEWAMYSDLGFLRVWGAQAVSTVEGDAYASAGDRAAADEVPCAYLIYPHLPIVAYLPQTGTLLGEYCVAFPDHTRPYGSERLPDSDDVLAKWLALTADERGLIAGANMHLPGRQIAPQRLRQDLARLARWESRRPHERARPALRLAG